MPQMTDEQIISTLIEKTRNCEVDNLNYYLEELTPAQKSLAAANDNQALQIAVSLERIEKIEIIKSLLNIPAVRDNAAVANNGTLEWAIRTGQSDIAKDLLTIPVVRRASLHQAEHLALSMGNIEIVEEISAIQETPDYTTIDPFFERTDDEIISTIMKMARDGDDAGLASYLDRLAPERKALAAANNNRALQLAAIYGHHKVVQILLTIPAVCDNAAAGDNLALLMALRKGYRLIAKDLLTFKTVRDNAAAYNNAALQCAAINDYGDIVSDLLTIPIVCQCSAADRENGHEATLLCTAKAYNILVEILEFLSHDGQKLPKSTQSFISDSKIMRAFLDVTPGVISLHKRIIACAVKGGHPDIVKDLTPTEDHKQILNTLSENELGKVVSLITIAAVRHYPKIDEKAPLQAALQLGYPGIAINLLTDLPNVRMSATAFNNEALIIAANRGYLGVMKELFKIPAVLSEAPTYINTIIECVFKAGKRRAQEEVQGLNDLLSSTPAFCRQFETMKVRSGPAAAATSNLGSPLDSQDEEKSAAATMQQKARRR